MWTSGLVGARVFYSLNVLQHFWVLGGFLLFQLTYITLYWRYIRKARKLGINIIIINVSFLFENTCYWQCIYPLNSVLYANFRLSCCQGSGSGWRELSRPDERRDGPELTAGAVPLLTHQYRSAHHTYNFTYSLFEANIVVEKHYVSIFGKIDYKVTDNWNIFAKMWKY